MTCRAVYRNVIELYIVASCWTIIDIGRDVVLYDLEIKVTPVRTSLV